MLAGNRHDPRTHTVTKAGDLGGACEPRADDADADGFSVSQSSFYFLAFCRLPSAPAVCSCLCPAYHSDLTQVLRSTVRLENSTEQALELGEIVLFTAMGSV